MAALRGAFIDFFFVGIGWYSTIGSTTHHDLEPSRPDWLWRVCALVMGTASFCVCLGKMGYTRRLDVMSHGNLAGLRTACPGAEMGWRDMILGSGHTLRRLWQPRLPPSVWRFPFTLFCLLFSFPLKTMCNHITSSCAGRSPACWRTGTVSIAQITDSEEHWMLLPEIV